MSIDYTHPLHSSGERSLQHYLIAGAPKCGTTTLANTFDSHPELVLSRIKEPNFFVTQKGFRDGGSFKAAAETGTLSRGGEYYHSLFDFAPETRAYGDASTAYMHCEETPALLGKLSPEAKIIMVVRYPIDRVYSHYLHDQRQTGKRGEAFECLVRNEGVDFQRYIWNSLYARHIRNFLKHFPPTQIRVVEYGHLFRNYRGIVGELFKFVGVDPDFEVPRRPEKRNKAANPRSMLLASLLFKVNRSGLGERFPFLRIAPVRKIKSAIYRANLGPSGEKPEHSVETRSRIFSHLEADLVDLARLQEEKPGVFIAPQGFAQQWASG